MARTSAEQDDLFDVFGDDSDSSDEGENDAAVVAETEIQRISKSLVQIANFRATVNSYDADGPASPSALLDHGGTESTELKNNTAKNAMAVNGSSSALETIIEFPWSPPLYRGPMKIVSLSEFGGGRGCVAERDLPPGTLLLVEEPIFAWSVDDNSLDLSKIRALLQHSMALQIVHDLEHFHPTKRAVDGVDDQSNPDQVESMMQTLRSQHSDDDELQTTLQFASKLQIFNADGSTLSESDMLRLLLALRYNGLESGIYRYAAMLNHADQPNCVKFLASSSSSTSYSEVRTTRAVKVGEPLTISYLPNIVSHASRRRHLWEQHRFDIGDISPPLRAMEMIGRQMPPSALHRRDDNSTTHRIERAVAELEAMLQDLQEDNESHSPDWFEKAKALEQASLELSAAARFQLQNENHVLLLPCNRLHLEACTLVLCSTALRRPDRLKLLGRTVVAAHRLLALQRQFHGPDHFDVARTNLDLAQAIEELLILSPPQLLALQLEGLTSVSSWSSLASQVRKDYVRIKGLYPRDGESYITLKSQKLC